MISSSCFLSCMGIRAALLMLMPSATSPNLLGSGVLCGVTAFGFESKNGHVKSLFHGKTSIVDQLVFVTDVIQTLQTVQCSLSSCKSEATLNYIAKVTGQAPRANMVKHANEVYSIGRTKPSELTTAEKIRLSLPSHSLAFHRAYIKGTLYYSKLYLQGQGKRDSTVCAFMNNRHIQFGEIQTFLLTPEPVAIVRVFEQFPRSFLNQAGNPCRPILEQYSDVDILSDYINAIEKESHEVVKVRLTSIISKAIILRIPSLPCNYVITQPNNFEHH